MNGFLQLHAKMMSYERCWQIIESQENMPLRRKPCKCVRSVAQLCPVLYNPMDCSLPGSSVHRINRPGKNTGVVCHFLLQGFFPTQGLNPHLLHLLYWQEDSLPLHHMGVRRKPCIIKWIKGYNGQWASTFAYLSLDIIWDAMWYDFRMEKGHIFLSSTCNGSLEFHRFAKVVLLRMCLQLSQSMLWEF